MSNKKAIIIVIVLGVVALFAIRYSLRHFNFRNLPKERLEEKVQIKGLDEEENKKIDFIQAEVWTGDLVSSGKRDESVYRYKNASILSGTGLQIVEYQESQMIPDNGTGYQLKVYTPEEAEFHKKNGPWDISFHNWNGETYMYGAYPVPSNNDFTKPDEGHDRALFGFIPKKDSRVTAGGFPLDWQLAHRDRIVTTYSGRMAQSHNGITYVLYDEGSDDGKGTCMWSRKMLNPVTASSARNALLCPGSYSKTLSRWNMDKPYPSEIRSNSSIDSGMNVGSPIVEGAWPYYANSKYYLFYSSGHYSSKDNYGGFVAICKDLESPCVKIMNDRGDDVKVLVPGASDNGYHMIGRPYPLIGQDGTLENVLFHARHPIDNGDDILRCKKTTHLGNQFLLDFESTGNGCVLEPRMGDYCGNAVCDANENSNSCGPDCGKCDNVATLSVKTDRTDYTSGDQIVGTISFENKTVEAFGAGMAIRVLNGSKLLRERKIGEGTFFAPGKTEREIPGGTELLKSGVYRIETQAQAGLCQWKAKTDFRISE